MIKLVCIVKRTHLTIGKVYVSDEVNENCYHLYDDLEDGIKTWYHKKNFMLLSEWREQQIKTVLDD